MTGPLWRTQPRSTVVGQGGFRQPIGKRRSDFHQFSGLDRLILPASERSLSTKTKPHDRMRRNARICCRPPTRELEYELQWGFVQKVQTPTGPGGVSGGSERRRLDQTNLP
jgi:hypothetical protein